MQWWIKSIAYIKNISVKYDASFLKEKIINCKFSTKGEKKKSIPEVFYYSVSIIKQILCIF